MNFTRECSICHTIIKYKTKSQFNDAIKKNRMCKLCANKIKSQNRKLYFGELKRKCFLCKKEIIYKKYHYFLHKILPKNENQILCKSCAESKFHKGKFISQETREKISKANTGKKRTDIYKQKMSKRVTGKNNPMYASKRVGILNPFYGKTHTSETKQKISDTLKNLPIERRKKMRLSAIKRLKLGQNNEMLPSYNKNSIPILEQKVRELGITDLQHAENGGEFHIKELGYWVDGYSKEKNVVIEYYEKHHKRQKEKDERRKQEIIKYLKCEFIEIKELNKI